VAELKAVNWDELGYGRVPADVMDKAVVAMEKFFATRTREELTQAAVERRIMLFPVATQGDILAHPQLAARGYFAELPVPGAPAPVPHPGAPVRDEGRRVGLGRPAPTIGEHNEKIYREELGLSSGDLTALRRWGAI
jgi:crotonobetainyl-CoA:carnitine CoA-transferase CaiB-like acyl-CoA transferase